MWSTSEDSEGSHFCGHFDTEIEVITIEDIRAKFFPKP